jgi:orotate phosphoribosyltransferase
MKKRSALESTEALPGASVPSESAQITAGALLGIEAVLIRPEEPFVLTSGRASPVYVDCRRIISFPRARDRLMDLAVETLRSAAGADAFDVVAGGETAGIPFAAWIAERLDLPMIYVRKKPKGFGRNARIEGTFEEGARVLLVEDLATDGGSKLSFVEAIRQAGGEIAHCFVIFSYGIFPRGAAALGEAGVALHALATWWDVLQVAEDRGELSEQAAQEVRAFLEDPEGWSAKHGGKTGGG